MTNQAPQSSTPPTISSSYPLPPTLLIQWYSDENISQGLNPEPPSPITDGSYSMFAVEIKVDEPIIRTLEDQDIKRLYPKEYDYRREIKKMNVSLMASMLDLLDALINCPESPVRQEKCTDIEMLFIQMHHLLNEMRPHQARETIRVKLDRQKKQRLDMINKLETQIEEVIEMVNSSIASIPDIVDSSIDLTDFMDDDSTCDKEETDVDSNSNNPSDEQIDQVTLLTQLDFLMCDIVDNLQVEAY